jgi:hypothetical protein
MRWLAGLAAGLAALWASSASAAVVVTSTPTINWNHAHEATRVWGTFTFQPPLINGAVVEIDFPQPIPVVHQLWTPLLVSWGYSYGPAGKKYGWLETGGLPLYNPAGDLTGVEQDFLLFDEQNAPLEVSFFGGRYVLSSVTEPAVWATLLAGLALAGAALRRRKLGKPNVPSAATMALG